MSMRQSGGATRDSLPQAISYCRKKWWVGIQVAGDGGKAGWGSWEGLGIKSRVDGTGWVKP